MNQRPLVSIVIPVYNGSNFLAQAIDSALAQTYPNTEVLVINDGSRDDGATERIALSYGARIRYYPKENGGVSSALNLGIQKMRGEYFSWLSHDDLYTPDKIEKQVALLEKAPPGAVLMCGTEYVDADARPLHRYQKPFREGAYTSSEMFSSIFSGCYISGCALLVPKTAFEQAGLFDTELKYMQDMQMWYRILLLGRPFYYAKDTGVLSRVHEKQTTVTSKHLGRQDALQVGEFLIDQLEKRDDAGALLKQYMFLCLRNRSPMAKKARAILGRKKQLSVRERIRCKWMQLYGGLRPVLVKLYYKLFFHIRIKSPSCPDSPADAANRK